MKTVKLGIIGLGTVGCGVVETLQKNQSFYQERFDIAFEIVIASVRDISRERSCNVSEFMLTDDSTEVVNHPDVEVVVELMGGTSVAYDLVMQALTNNKHVVTANKALIAECGNQVFELARQQSRLVAYEAAVAGGIPILKNLRESVTANPIEWIAGIINGTGNYILTEMKKPDAVFSDVLKTAQDLGYAEADPTFDVEGIDSAHKLLILSALAFQVPLDFSRVYMEGISKIEAEDITYADSLGYQIKHLGITRKVQDRVEIRVHPTLVANNNILAQVHGVMNAVLVHNENAGSTLYYGAGAGSYPTASAIVADLVDFARNPQMLADSCISEAQKQIETIPIGSIVSAYYLRMKAVDHAGVLSRISDVLANLNISIEQLHQDHVDESAAILVMITNQVKETTIKQAIQRIVDLEILTGSIQCIRVADLA